MKIQDYRAWMDNIESPKDLRKQILDKVPQHKQPKRYPYVVVAGFVCILFALCINSILPSSVSLSFTIEVQAKEPIHYDSDEQIHIVMQNPQTISNDGTRHGFYAKQWSSDSQLGYQVLLTLPIIIQGEDIESISYQVENNTLIPRYALDNLILDDDETTVLAIQEHVVMNNEERHNFQSRKTYSEMSDQGKTIFENYIEMYKEQLLQNNWWKDTEFSENSQDIFYDDAYTDMLLFEMRAISREQDVTNETLLRKMRLDEYRYFTWGKKDETKHYTFDYKKQANKEENIQLSIRSSSDDVVNQLATQTIKMVVTFKNGTQLNKTISFQNINTVTNEYTLVIE